jgi:solute carrier family 8 (sodium/calcium exchanger)
MIYANHLFLFLAAQSEIIFEHGEISKIIAIPIINDLEAEKDESFAVELYDPTGGASLGKHTKTVVTIINDDGTYLVENKAEKKKYFFSFI